MRKLDFRLWELSLIGLAFVLFVFSVGGYVADYALREIVLGTERRNEKESVGKLGLKTGGVRREVYGDTGFKVLETQQPLYNRDTVVTSESSSAVLELDDGGTVELGPSAMVRLNFESEISLGGISRVASVDVVTGRVTGRAKAKPLVIRSRDQVISIKKNTVQIVQPKPVELKPLIKVAPSPTPEVSVAPEPPTPVRMTKLLLLAPKRNERFVVEKSAQPQRRISFDWQVEPPELPVKVILREVEKSKKANVVFSEVSQTTDKTGRKVWLAQAPGEYEIELLEQSASKDALAARARFWVESQFEGIKLLPPLIGGVEAQTNKLTGMRLKAFEIALKWEPFAGVETYVVSVGSSPNGKPTVVRQVSTTELVLNRDKVFNGRVFYRVTGALKSGFVVTSPVKELGFEFLPPGLTQPADRSLVSAAVLAANAGKVLLVWQKTNFTDQYEVQVARDVQFTNQVSTRLGPDNFFVLKNPAQGLHYWRVRSISKTLSSPFSKPYVFTVRP